MRDLTSSENQICRVSSFEQLVSTPFSGEVNAICWTRELTGDFSEIVEKIMLTENIIAVEAEDLLQLRLGEQGHLAREILINDLKLLKALGASPTLNVIRHYDRDEASPFFPTDVYSWHADRSPMPVDTFLCTYYGEASELLPNAQGEKKTLIPEIRDELKKSYDGPDDEFELFLSENSFDLHYQAKPKAHPVSLGNYHLWKLAVDHPESKVLPCIHRAPKEKPGQKRLLMIC